VALCYFGTAKPSVYGIRSIDWMADEIETSTCDWLAISATSLQGVYSKSSKISELFEHVPSTRAGYSIFLYDLKNPRVREAWQAIRSPSSHPLDSSQKPPAN
jgi:hypothetical protein